jgi:hypothetical protein
MLAAAALNVVRYAERARDARDFFHSQAKLADDGQSIKEGVTVSPWSVLQTSCSAQDDEDRTLDKAAAT